MTNKHLDDTIDTNDTIVVKTQRMFPNCQKYKKCCYVHNMEEMLKDMEEKNDKN